jgi:hypothetical protein
LDETVPSLKLQKAREWKIPVENREWLFREIEKVYVFDSN